MTGPTPSSSPPEGHGTQGAPSSSAAETPAPRAALATAALGALGVVFGDIGTSPLYALKECFAGTHPVPVSIDNVYGVLSLVTWSLILIVSVKYIAFILRADNRGEGGILALLSLAIAKKSAGGQPRRSLILVGLFGAALLYGDGAITPAISVLSAIEGLRDPKIGTPVPEEWITWIAVTIILVLFLFQSRGTRAVGRVFGPVMVLWFTALALLGLTGISQHPEILGALNPVHGVRFFADNGGKGFLVLGAVFLCVTGGEALYADMGHFGRRPIRAAWFGLVLPALLLNYYGQGGQLLADPSGAASPFYHLVPKWALVPMVVLATLAAIIASQALISGAFSLTRQAVQLGYSPRFEVTHTSAHEIGQIYVRGVNWMLLVAVCVLVLGFKNSSSLAAAYGIAVTMTMVITTVLAFFVARDLWGWSTLTASLVCAGFLVIELAFFGANALKFAHGGWVPIVIGLVVFTLMTTWNRGRALLAQRLRAQQLPLEPFLESLARNMPTRVPGTAVFMTGAPEGTPRALLHNLKHNRVLHEQVVLLTVSTLEVPHVHDDERLLVEHLAHGFHRVTARFGFMEHPDVPSLFPALRERGVDLRIMQTTFFLGRETLIPSGRRDMAKWREVLFAWMSRNAQTATAYFGLPAGRVVELGMQVEL